ncbi:cytidylyltransferase domain-containing protein [Nonomuraea rubra]|uniref:acylneuraminate cytidylyltransferase family protein n=1 Tax=Nonomuraea rubra TaxID=46180 RepID=UPI00361ABCB2
MRVLAVVPARGGSAGVPLKNLALVGGVPLVTRAVRACLRAELVDQVVVSTDHDGIAETAREAGAIVVERPAELSGSTASSESAVLHALDALGEDPEVVVLVQATSAFIDPDDLSAAVRKVLDGEADSVVSGLPTHEFLWTATGGGINHDPAVRQRRQDRAPEFRENGAFYVMRTAGLREHGHRFFGEIAVQPVPPSTPSRSTTRRTWSSCERSPRSSTSPSRSTWTPSSPTSTACTPTTAPTSTPTAARWCWSAAPTGWASRC